MGRDPSGGWTDKQYLNRFPEFFQEWVRGSESELQGTDPESEFVVCEMRAVSALDVSVCAQVLNLMRNMQQKKI